MSTLGNLYRKYLRGVELGTQSFVVEIVAITQVTVTPHPQAQPIEKWCMWVKGLPVDLPNGILFGPKAEEQLVLIFGKVDINTLRGKTLEIYPQPLSVAGNRRVAIHFRKATPGRQVAEPPEAYDLRNRYQCQFRDWDKTYYMTDCAWSEENRARNHVDLIVSCVADVSEGRVFDSMTGKYIYYAAK
jgi:hypothetical protein